MTQDSITQHHRLIGWAYFFMFLALFTVVTGLVAYGLAMKVAHAKDVEVWVQAQAFWIMRNIILFMLMAIFAVLWFIPLHFYVWDAMQWVTGCTIVGIIFSFIAWMFLINTFIQGFFKYLKKKAVF